MQIVSLELVGFKSFGKKTIIKFDSAITGVVGPNGSGKSNVAEAIRFVLGEQSIKSMRGRLGTDLIFKGSSELSALGRASVTAVFDNRKTNKHTNLTEGVFAYLQYDEVRITREIYADGANEYLINDTKVRVKDIQELLSTVNIGTSGHHMISQGEADRVLNASPRERREMVEDALGLKLYQIRIKDAQRKLEKTDQHLREGEIARKEIAPHLGYLKKQVERIEARKEQANELALLYSVYLHREHTDIENEKSALIESGASSAHKGKKEQLEEKLKQIQELLNQNSVQDSENESIQNLEFEVAELQKTRDDIYKRVFRLEAEEAVIEKSLTQARAQEEKANITASKVYTDKRFAEDTKIKLSDALDQLKWRIEKHELVEVPNYIGLLRSTHNDFFKTLLETEELSFIVADSDSLEVELANCISNKLEQNKILVDIEQTLNTKKSEVNHFKNKILGNREIKHEQEKSLYEIRAEIVECNNAISRQSSREESLRIKTDRMTDEIAEGSVLIGSDILSYRQTDLAIVDDARSQTELHRVIERLKIKLEDSGVSNVTDIKREFSETTERDEFLRKEIEDLITTKESLLGLIIDLEQTLGREFEFGLTRINTQFGIFFSDMFGGGTAVIEKTEREKRGRKKTTDDGELVELESAEVETETGIEVHVALPHKKVRDLSMLSGGERALTSIALLFAISQVNPPPFMVLDETDAALDEANARRYGKSLRSLAEHSKLVVITHNRETMNQADVLYGITVGKDGVSKVLSVRFDEASEYAK